MEKKLHETIGFIDYRQTKERSCAPMRGKSSYRINRKSYRKMSRGDGTGICPFCLKVVAPLTAPGMHKVNCSTWWRVRYTSLFHICSDDTRYTYTIKKILVFFLKEEHGMPQNHSEIGTYFRKHRFDCVRTCHRNSHICTGIRQEEN